MVPVIRKHVVKKLINGRKYLFAGMFETHESAVKFADMERKHKLITKIFKLVGAKEPYRVYIRQPIMEYNQKSGTVLRKF